MRPDEQASQAYIDRENSSNNLLKNTVKGALALGTGGAATALGSRLMPFFSQYLTPDIALKGISKVSPEIGSFLNKGLQSGLNIKDGLDFVKNKILQPQENRSIIQQYSDKLHQFIEGEIQKGRSPMQAGAVARLEKEFKEPIKKMEKDHKSDFSSILTSIYGDGQQQAQPQQQMQPEQMKPDPQQTQQPQMQQGNNSDSALLAALDKILKM